MASGARGMTSATVLSATGVRIFSTPRGTDPYVFAVSDVYQDLFGEGSFAGKGIYDIEAFEAAIAGKIPENAMLSHDLFEGMFARAGLASDIEVVEDFPNRYDVDIRRHHFTIAGFKQYIVKGQATIGNAILHLPFSRSVIP